MSGDADLPVPGLARLGLQLVELEKGRVELRPEPGRSVEREALGLCRDYVSREAAARAVHAWYRETGRRGPLLTLGDTSKTTPGPTLRAARETALLTLAEAGRLAYPGLSEAKGASLLAAAEARGWRASAAQPYLDRLAGAVSRRVTPTPTQAAELRRHLCAAEARAMEAERLLGLAEARATMEAERLQRRLGASEQRLAQARLRLDAAREELRAPRLRAELAEVLGAEGDDPASLLEAARRLRNST